MALASLLFLLPQGLCTCCLLCLKHCPFRELQALTPQFLQCPLQGPLINIGFHEKPEVQHLMVKVHSQP